MSRHQPIFFPYVSQVTTPMNIDQIGTCLRELVNAVNQISSNLSSLSATTETLAIRHDDQIEVALRVALEDRIWRTGIGPKGRCPQNEAEADTVVKEIVDGIFASQAIVDALTAVRVKASNVLNEREPKQSLAPPYDAANPPVVERKP